MEIDLNRIRFVTLYTGERGQESCRCKCPCCTQAPKHSRYQGTGDQIDKLLNELPSLEQLYILGNPDPSMDTGFCNLVARTSTARGIHVAFSTSGAGGKSTLMQLLNGLAPNMVDYVSFSFDTIDREKLSLLKGIRFPWDKAVEGVCWAIENGYTVKVQPTLWSCNWSDAGRVIDYFAPMGVKWFTFHIGSLESGVSLPTHQHLTAGEVSEVHNLIDEAVKRHPGIKVRCPIIFPRCGDDDRGKYYCMHVNRCEELMATFTSNGIVCTHAPIVSGFQSSLTFKLGETPEVPEMQPSQYCPIGSVLAGDKTTYCRFVSRTWNY